MENKETAKHHAGIHAPFSAMGEIPSVFPAIDNDLAAENLENDFDMTAADLQDLRFGPL